MIFNKRQGEFLQATIDAWEAGGTIPKETADQLRGSFSIRPFDFRRAAKYSFWIAIVCAVISFGAIVADEWLVAWVRRLFASSNIALCLTFAALAAAVYYWGLTRRRRMPEKVFSNESVFFAGVLLTAVSVAYLGMALDTGSGHYSLLLLLSALIYAGLGLWFPSKLVWLFALLSLGSWFGAETGYLSDWGAYYLGMNYPLRFVLFGAVLVGAAFVIKGRHRLSDFHRPTYIMGLLYLFIALWILSIVGNYGDIEGWNGVRQWQLVQWGLLACAVSIAAIYFGLAQDDPTARGFGLTFLFINLYTRFFEYLWDVSHKAIFFAVLAASFWFIGQRAERIWNLEFLKKGKTGEG